MVRLKYQQIIQEQVRKQKLTVTSKIGLNSYLSRMSSEDWSQSYVDFKLCDALMGILRNKKDTTSKRLYKMLKRMRFEGQSDELKHMTKFAYSKTKTYKNIEAFLTPEKPRPYFSAYKQALQIVKEIMRGQFTGYLKPLDIYEGMNLTDVLSTDDTSMGYLLLDSKKRQNPELLISTAMEFLKVLPKDTNIYAVYTRVQQKGGVNEETGELEPETFEQKHRSVMGVDGAMSLCEAIYAKPLMKYVISMMQQYAGAKEPVELRRLIGHANSCMDRWISIDFSKFDQTVPSWLIYDVWDIMKIFYANSEHNLKVMDWLRDNFIHSRILMYDGSIVTKHKGIASGSQFTQIVGSLCNMVIILTYVISLAMQRVGVKKINSDVLCYAYWMISGHRVKIQSQISWCGVHMFVMGDDNLLFLNTEISMTELASYIRYNFGMEVNPDKCTWKYKDGNVYPEFLKRYWMPGGEYRNIYALVLNMILPEKKRTYEDYSPYEIIYGYYITYSKAFQPFLSEAELVRLMGGYRTLLDFKVRSSDLPGSLRVLMMHRNDYFMQLGKRWKDFLAQ